MIEQSFIASYSILRFDHHSCAGKSEENNESMSMLLSYEADDGKHFLLSSLLSHPVTTGPSSGESSIDLDAATIADTIDAAAMTTGRIGRPSTDSSSTAVHGAGPRSIMTVRRRQVDHDMIIDDGTMAPILW